MRKRQLLGNLLWLPLGALIVAVQMPSWYPWFLPVAMCVAGLLVAPLASGRTSSKLLYCCVLLAATALSRQSFLGFDGTLTEKASTQPLQQVAGIAEQVYLGGQTAQFEKGKATTCFFTDDGYGVLAAHHWPGRQTGPHAFWLVDDDSSQETEINILANADSGVLFEYSGLDISTPKMSIGGTEDIVVGGKAMLYSQYNGSFPVIVLGYKMLPTFSGEKVAQFLSIRPLHYKNSIIHGMSGSPIVQGEKIIGFITATTTEANHRKPWAGHARLAADIYREALAHPVVARP